MEGADAYFFFHYHLAAHWSAWSNWSSCSKNCQKKYSTRSRTCYINEDTYKACKGHSSEVRKCPCIHKPKPPKPKGPTIVQGLLFMISFYKSRKYAVNPNSSPLYHILEPHLHNDIGIFTIICIFI